jgi:GT2 family glycosyltransferase
MDFVVLSSLSEISNTFMIRALYTIIVNWNLKIDVLACISSLRTAGAPLDQIIVVDNGSSDGSVDALRTIYGPDLRILPNKVNLGFAVGNNLGIKHALDLRAEWIFLLNNDTTVAPTLFTELAKVIKNNPQYGIISPLIMAYDDPDRIWNLGNRRIPGTLITYSPHKGRTDKGNLPHLVPVDFITGCGMIVNAGVFKKIGLLNSKYFMYGEDVEFCWKAQQAGFKIACATKGKIWHKGSASAKRDKPRFRYLQIRNQIRFYREFANYIQMPIMVAFSLLRILWITLLDILKQQPELIIPSYAGFLNGWFQFNTEKNFKNHGN